MSSVVGPSTPALLPLRAPLFLLLVVEAVREGICSSKTSSSLSMTVDNSSRSNVGSKDGARERERVGIAGVRTAGVLKEDCLELGR